MSSLQDEPAAIAYQAKQTMPDAGIRATDWVVVRPTTHVAPGDLILCRYDGVMTAGRLLRSDGGLVFHDGTRCEDCSLREPHSLRVLGVVIAVCGEGAFH